MKIPPGMPFKERVSPFQPGTRQCFVLENDAEHREIITPFMRLGLETGERVLYLGHPLSPEAILGPLKNEGLDPDPFLKTGQLCIVDVQETLLKDGTFNPDSAMQWIQDAMQKTLDAGFSGLRITVEMSWILSVSDSETFIRFQHRLDAWIIKNKALWLCQYDRRKTTSTFLLHALTTCPVVILGTKYIENFYYIPPRESLGFDSEDAIVDHWIQNLITRKKADEALESRIRFQQLLMHLSASFVESGDTDAKIHQALKAIGNFAQVDRVFLFQARPDGLLFDNTHEWCAPGIDPQITHFQKIAVNEELPWFWKKLCADETFQMTDIFDIPMEGRRDREYFEKQGIQSLAVVPMLSKKTVKGFLGVHRVRQSRHWPEDTLMLLKITSQILSTFLDRKRAEKEIQERETKFKALFEAVSDLIFTQDLAGRFLSFNPALVQLLGYGPEELIGRPPSDFMKPELKPLFYSEYLKEVLEKGHHQGTSLYFAKDGRKVYIEYQSVLVRPEGAAPFISGIGRDVTEKILSKRKIQGLQEQILQSKKMEAIGTLAGGIAHDFNNILGIILGNAELALEDVPEWSPIRHNLEEIQTASLRARDVIKQLLSFSRKTEHARSPLKLSALIKETIKLLRATIPANIAIHTRIDEDTDPVLANPAQMHQVLINLCTNASHAMQDLGGTLTIALSNQDIDTPMVVGSVSLGPGRYVKLTVSDTGPGIKAEYMDRIFDPYFTTKEAGKGTGLGLSVVHGIVQNHRGLITAESRPGKETVFSIYLPAFTGKLKPPTKKSERLPTGSERILLIDDEMFIVETCVQLLERLGYRVQGRTDPLDALALFSRDPFAFDLVITDMTMPHMTGDRLSEKILAIRPDMPILLCTGFSHKIDADTVAKLGVRGYLEKPMNRMELALAIRKALDGSSEERPVSSPSASPPRRAHSS